MKLEKRLELLKQKAQEDDFLSARGLGNEIPFWIFDHPPEKELLIRETTNQPQRTSPMRNKELFISTYFD